jgi:hypothetical protein
MTTIKCRIGLVAKIKNDLKSYVFLGEIFDPHIRKDINKLYELHNNLQYLYPFKIGINKTNINLNNIEDIYSLQEKYKLTRKIYVKNKKLTGIKHCLKPQLYDISCMTPLFSTKTVKRKIPVKLIDPEKIFILMPYKDPIIRGEIIHSCLHIMDNNKAIFICIGDKCGKNLLSTSSLIKKYLITLGVNHTSIICQTYDNPIDCIMEALIMLTMIIQDGTPDIFICVEKHDMGKMLHNIKYINKTTNIINNKIKFICN